jgi:tRNA pseudouridine55 synthase
VRGITVDLVRDVLDSFRGEIEQIPPAYSCVKVGGRRLHELAREGTPAEAPARRVQIKDLEMVDFKDGGINIRVVCSKGTYIRALARDIGEKLGCLGHLHNLVRLRVGENLLKNSIDIDMVSGLEEHLMSMKNALRRYPTVNLGTKDSSGFRFGQMVELHHPDCGPEAHLVRVCDASENLIGVGKVEEGMLVPLRVLA